MWVANNNKERIKSYLRSDIESNITNLCDASNHIHDTISAINRATAGSLSGFDHQMIDECQRAIMEISESLQNLYECRNHLDHLDTREWVDD